MVVRVISSMVAAIWKHMTVTIKPDITNIANCYSRHKQTSNFKYCSNLSWSQGWQRRDKNIGYILRQHKEQVGRGPVFAEGAGMVRHLQKG
jgi:hypothetical protein